MLVKFRLTVTVVFSSVVAFLIASQASDLLAVGILAAGGFLVTGAANTLNQVLEKDFDRLMKRTADRPLAAGRMAVSEAVLSAGMMSLAGITLLAMFNPWTAFFGTFSLVLYAFVYTPMKRISPSAVFIGAIPGALPTLIGVVAAQGGLTPLALSLFALQFLWQFPHFWSIGWLGFEDYRKAGYSLVPASAEGKPDAVIGKQALYYSLMLLPVSMLPYYLGTTGVVSLGIVILLSLCYVAFSWNFFRKADRRSALQLMFFSFLYIPVSLIAFWADKI
ncbi:protoheme IX farnesyltransferase [Phaeodactylibacter luteus]|uniref:Protoheme IX farnesyltransferase n=2 Tax=Phaeodactylibacter luteus TaxID=1564516 RepID=A0A5C6RM05_9BACT|nr:protoheme IX farnesyltransferase [Phaeodactylibacter luteus]